MKRMFPTGSDAQVMLTPLLSLFSGRVGGMVFQFFALVLVGWNSGASAIGVFQLGLVWSCLVGEFAAAGIPVHAMRRFAVRGPIVPAPVLLGYMRQALCRVGALWLVAVAAGCWFVDDLAVLFPIAAAALAFSLLRISCELMKSMTQGTVAIVLENFGPYAPLVVMLLVASMFSIEISELVLLWAVCTGFVSSAVIALIWLWRNCVGEISDARDAVQISVAWAECMAPWGSALLQLSFLSAPLLILPLFAAAEEVGAFALAYKLVNPATALLAFLGAYFGPRFVRAFESGQQNRLQGLFVQSCILSGGVFVLFAVPIYVFAGYLCDWFDLSRSTVTPYLLVLMIAHAVNAVTGPKTLLLNMCARSTLDFKVLLVSTGVLFPAMWFAGSLHGVAALVNVYVLVFVVKALLGFVACSLVLKHGTDSTRAQSYRVASLA